MSELKTQSEKLIELFESGDRKEATRLCIASSVFTHRGLSDNFQIHRFLDDSYLQRGFSSDLTAAEAREEMDSGSLEYPISRDLFKVLIPSEQYCQVLKSKEVVAHAVDEMILKDPELLDKHKYFGGNKFLESALAAKLEMTGISEYIDIEMAVAEFFCLRKDDRDRFELNKSFELDNKWKVAS